MKKNYSKEESRPNIIYILGDDHRKDFMNNAGHPIVETPNLDKLAEEGILFKNAFCTSPTCTPSRTCHYLGQWERKHGVNFNSDSSVAPAAWENSFPMELKKHGYYTGWVGKNHVPAGEGGYKSGYFEEKFDYWYGNHGHSHFYPKEHEGGEIYKNAKADTQVEIFEEGAFNFLEPDLDFIESCTSPLPYRPEDKPFCLCITFNLPHGASTGTMQLRPSDDELYKSKYRDKFNDFPLPKTYSSPVYMGETPRRLPEDIWNGIYIPTYDYVKRPVFLRERMVRVSQTITGVDRMIGNLREKLKEMNLADNTIIIFSTDHGIHHGEHGIGGKAFLYEEDLRIPLIIYDPRIPEELKGQTREELVVVPDLAPTVMELLDYDIPYTMQGTSLLPLINDEDVNWRQEIFAEQLMDIQNYPKSECVRSKGWKYIRYFKRTEDPAQEGWLYRSTLDDYDNFLYDSVTGKVKPAYEELYHLAEDPYEEYNLADDEKYTTVLDKMRNKLIELAGKYKEGDTEPLTLPLVK